MSYRNPAIIKDDSGLIVPNAIAQGIENVAKGYKEGLARDERVRIDNAKSNARRAAQNMKEADRMAEQELMAKKGTEGMGNELGTSTYNVRKEILGEVNDARNIILNPNSSNKELEKANQQYSSLMSELASVNTFAEKYTLMHSDANDRVNGIQSADGTWEYAVDPEHDTEDNAGGYAQKLDFAIGGINNSGVSLSRTNGVTSMIGHGGKDSDFNYIKPISEVNSNGFDTVVGITQLTVLSQKALDAALVDDQDPNQIAGDLRVDKMAYNKVIVEDGKVFNTTVEDINTKKFDILYDNIVNEAVAGLETLPYQNRNANLRKLGVLPKTYNALISDTVNPIASQAEAKKLVTDAYREQIIKGSAQKLKRDDSGNLTRTLAVKEVIWKNKDQMSKLDINEGFENMKERSGYDANVPGSMSLKQLFSEALNGDISVDGSKKTISEVNIKDGVLYIHRNSSGLETDAANYRKPMEYVLNDPGQIASALKNIYQNRGMKPTNAYEAGAQLEKLYFDQLQN